MLSRYSGLCKFLEIALKRLVTLVRAIGAYFTSALIPPTLNIALLMGYFRAVIHDE